MGFRAYAQRDVILVDGPFLDIRQFGQTFDATTLLNAINNITDDRPLIIVPGDWSILFDTVSFPENITVYALKGVRFNIGLNASLHIESLVAGDYQIFYDSPQNATVGANNIKNKLWWGEVFEYNFNNVSVEKSLIVKELSTAENAVSGYGKIFFTDDGKIHAINSLGDNAFESIGQWTSEELLEYEFLLQGSRYKNCKFDLFVDLGQTDQAVTSAAYSSTGSVFHGTSSSVFQSLDLFPDSDPLLTPIQNFYFYAHVSDESLFEFYYSFNKIDWVQIQNNSKVELADIITGPLYFRFVWTGTADLFSYGILFQEQNFSISTDTRMLQIQTLTDDYTAPVIMNLPNNVTYTNDGKSLEIYLNGLRLTKDVDYEEVNSRQVRFLKNLSTNDIIVYTEKFGQIDTSIENKSRLDYEHNALGEHVLIDKITNQAYKLIVENGQLVLDPV